MWVAWSPTGTNVVKDIALPNPGGVVMSAERMPLKAGAAEPVRYETRKDKTLSVQVTESPTYLWIRGQ